MTDSGPSDDGCAGGDRHITVATGHKVAVGALPAQRQTANQFGAFLLGNAPQLLSAAVIAVATNDAQRAAFVAAALR